MDSIDHIRTIIRNFLLNATFNRGIGKTTYLREYAKKIDGIFLVQNKTNHDDVYWNSPQLIGETRPFVYDHYTFENILKNVLREFDHCEAEFKRLHEQIFGLEAQKIDLQNERSILFEKLEELGLKYSFLKRKGYEDDLHR